jgi:hypothetical protein
VSSFGTSLVTLVSVGSVAGGAFLVAACGADASSRMPYRDATIDDAGSSSGGAHNAAGGTKSGTGGAIASGGAKSGSGGAATTGSGGAHTGSGGAGSDDGGATGGSGGATVETDASFGSDGGRDASTLDASSDGSSGDDAGDASGNCSFGTAANLATDQSLNLFGDIVYFGGGAVLPAGRYRVTYLDGCMKYGGGQDWTIHAYADGHDAWWFGAASGNQLVMPPGTFGYSTGTGAYANFADCVTANQALAPKEFDFAGGQLGVWLQDSPVSDNLAGEDGRNPKWKLERLGGCEASDGG